MAKTSLNQIIEEMDAHAKNMGVSTFTELNTLLNGIGHWETFKEVHLDCKFWDYVLPSRVDDCFMIVVEVSGMLHLHRVSANYLGVSEVSASKRHWVWLRNEQYRRAYHEQH